MVGRDWSVRVYVNATLTSARERGFAPRVIARGLGVSEVYASRLGGDPVLVDFHRAVRDAGFRGRLQLELALPELRAERHPTLVS